MLIAFSDMLAGFKYSCYNCFHITTFTIRATKNSNTHHVYFSTPIRTAPPVEKAPEASAPVGHTPATPVSSYRAPIPIPKQTRLNAQKPPVGRCAGKLEYL